MALLEGLHFGAKNGPRSVQAMDGIVIGATLDRLLKTVFESFRGFRLARGW